MPGFEEFLKPATSPTYTDLARDVDRLKADNAALLKVAKFLERMLQDVVANGPGADLGWMDQSTASEMLAVIRHPHPGSATLDEMERLKATCKTLNRRDGEIRQQAILDLAHELAEMEPAARDAAIRRIIDRSEDKS